MNNSSTILAIDIGDRRHGLAIAHLPTRVALPLTILPHSRHFLTDLAKLHAEHNFSLIVIGLPLTLAGGRSPQTAKVEKLAQKIGDFLKVPIALEDERFTTRQAHGLTLASGRKDPATQIDAVAAQLILEHWLARHP